MNYRTDRGDRHAEQSEARRIRITRQTREFRDSIDQLRDNTDAITIPSVSIKRKIGGKVVGYHLAKFPMTLKLTVTFYGTVYPFESYYNRDYYPNEVPEKHRAEFETLEKFLMMGMKYEEKKREKKSVDK